MSEQELNAATQKSPCDLLKDRKKQYDDEYRKLSREGSFQLKRWKKTIRRCRIYKTLDLLRSLLFIAFSLFFLETSLMACGFTTDRYVGYGIIGLIVISILVDLLFFILVLFGQMFLKRALMLTRVTLFICTVIIALVSWILFGMVSYFCVLLMFVLLFALTSDLPFDKVLVQLISWIFFIGAIAVTVLCMLGVIRETQGRLLHERDINSSFAMYTIAEDENGQESATFSDVLLTAKDVLSYGDKGVYNIPEAVKDNIKVTALGEMAFKGVASCYAVALPESVTKINAGAFGGSEIRTIEISASEIYIADALEGSMIEEIRLLSPSPTKIIIGDGYTLPENVKILVPSHLVWDCRAINPDLAEIIIPINN